MSDANDLADMAYAEMHAAGLQLDIIELKEEIERLNGVIFDLRCELREAREEYDK